MTREHTTEIMLPATPEEVWRSLTDASFVQTWFAPEVRIDARVGGEYMVSWAPGMEGTGKIEVLEENRHLRVVNERAIPAGAEPVRMAMDYFLEGEGGQTRLRLVHSGFLTSADWDGEYNGTKTGWPIMFRIMRYGLERQPGKPGRQRWLYAMAGVSPAEAWKRFADLFPGVTPEYVQEPSEFCGRWAEPGEGLVYAAFAETRGVTAVSLLVMLYGEAMERIDAAGADWTARLAALYPAAG